jgi:cytoskeletal protein CcmA (bactofilin family)
MAGYTRQDTANNIANGNVIDADDFDNEFNAIDAAFNNSTGHVHDGTAENGAPITRLGPVQDIIATATLLRPKTTNVISLGTDAVRYKDLFLEGDADIDGTVNVQGATTLQDTLAVTSNVTVGGNLTVTGNATIAGNLTFGDAATDTVSFAADVSSNVLPATDDTYDLGAVGSEWRNLYIDGTANIDTAAVDTANVGTLNVTGNADVDGDLTVTGSINASISGVAATADALTTARTIALAGDVSGAANFDGSSNITITTVIADDSHNHTIANVDGLQAALDAKPDGLSDLGVTALSTELNILDGVTATTAEINILDGVTATTAELNILDGVTASTAELNYVDGVTSNIQTQLDTKVTSFSLETYTGDVDIDGELIVTSYNETYQAVSSSSNATTINCETGNVFSHTLSENTTFTFSSPPPSGTAYGFSLKIIQDASASGYTVTWPTSVDWPDQVTPPLTTSANAVDQFVFYTHDGGTTWYGFKAGRNMG